MLVSDSALRARDPAICRTAWLKQRDSPCGSMGAQLGAATLTRINSLDGRRKESFANYAGRRCPTGTLCDIRFAKEQQLFPGDQR
jgi:hypothetical protein